MPASLEHPQPTWALILKKAVSQAKSRLASVLSESQRLTLVENLFQHVLAETLRTAQIDRVAVISPEKPALPENVLWIRDTCGELNSCILQGIGEISAQGGTRVLVLPCDLPLLSSGELAELVNLSADCDMVIAPDECEAGTNALLLKLPSDFQPRFGCDSFRKHIDQANRMGLKTTVMRTSGLAFDLDDQQDWQRFCHSNEPLSAALTL